MKVSMLVTPAAHLDELKELFAWADEVDLACAWASAGDGTAAHWKCIDVSKIRRAVIGVEFAQTEPWVLRTLLECKCLRIGQATGTFHPKVYMATQGENVRAIVGSANFTRAAFSSNVELGVLLEGKKTDPQMKELAKFIKDQWQGGMMVDEGWIEDYQVSYKNRPKPPLIPGAKMQVTSVEDLQMPWPEYYRALRLQENRIEGIGVFQGNSSYTRELDDIQRVFETYTKFAKMPEAQRRLLMGLPGDSTGLIGSMGAARHAKKLVKSEPGKIGVYLDQVPLKGPVKIELVNKVMRGMTSLHGVKLGVATRLLTVKRPDLFVSVNNGSNPQLATLLRRRQVKTVPHYLDLLQAVWQLEWHKAPPPTDAHQRKTWSRRAALLDSIFYEVVK
jgi:hypothetical protein